MKLGVIIKNTFRILLRSKAFLFFAIVIPLISIGVLNVKMFMGKEDQAESDQLCVMEKIDDKIGYIQDPVKLSVRVLDQSKSNAGKAFAQELVSSGLFQIFYYDASNDSVERVDETIKNVGKNDKIDGLIWLKDSFVTNLKEKNAGQGIVFYDSKTDDRTTILYDTIEKLAGHYETLASQITTEDGWKQYEEQSVLGKMKKVIVQTDAVGELSADESNQVQKIAVVYAILSLSFLFTGVMIADTVVKERENKVFLRICLSDLSTIQYLIGKFIVSFLCVILQTAVTAFGMIVILNQTYAIEFGPLIFSIFVQGIIFSTLSLSIGILLNNTMNSNFMSFVIWSMSALISGCYFDLSEGGTVLNAISKLAPQKWAIEFVREIIGKTGTPYVILIVSAFAFLCISGAIGAIACKRTIVE